MAGHNGLLDFINLMNQWKIQTQRAYIQSSRGGQKTRSSMRQANWVKTAVYSSADAEKASREIWNGQVSAPILRILNFDTALWHVCWFWNHQMRIHVISVFISLSFLDWTGLPRTEKKSKIIRYLLYWPRHCLINYSAVHSFHRVQWFLQSSSPSCPCQMFN